MTDQDEIEFHRRMAKACFQHLSQDDVQTIMSVSAGQDTCTRFAVLLSSYAGNLYESEDLAKLVLSVAKRVLRDGGQAS